MTDTGQRINVAGFEIVTGVALGITLLIAVGRIYTKISNFHRLFVDDGFFILATILLVAGTALQLVALLYGQTSVNVGAGVEYAIILLYASVFSVKFSFLFIFRLLLQRTKLRIWWWCVTIFTIPCAIVCMCTPLMICSTFDDQIIESCFLKPSIQRFEAATLCVAVVLSILTDVLANIIRAAGHKLKNGQQDGLWIDLWVQLEACVAIVANSMTAFRSLSTAGHSRARVSPQHQRKSLKLLTKPLNRAPYVELPTMPTATPLSLNSRMRHDHLVDRTVTCSGDTLRGLDEREIAQPASTSSGPGIRVVQSFEAWFNHHPQSGPSKWQGEETPSNETLV